MKDFTECSQSHTEELVVLLCCLQSVTLGLALNGQNDANTRSITCAKGWFPCGVNSSLCVEQQKQCDGTPDCPNGEDEAYEHCGK